MWINVNAWREVMAKIFDGFVTEYDVSPDWLVNPETRRRLKLDLLYPEVGIAVRFQGLRGREQRQRPTLEEEEQQKVRDSARADLCEAHGIHLVSIDAEAGEPKAILRELSMALSDASRRIAKNGRPGSQKRALLERVSEARLRLDDIGRRVRRPADLKLYADLWEDRQYADTSESAASAKKRPMRSYTPGMAVRHAVFGDGIVQAVQPDGSDNLVCVRFADGSDKTFIASLVSDKLVSR
jgi:hypothetical protein